MLRKESGRMTCDVMDDSAVAMLGLCGVNEGGGNEEAWDLVGSAYRRLSFHRIRWS